MFKCVEIRQCSNKFYIRSSIFEFRSSNAPTCISCLNFDNAEMQDQNEVFRDNVVAVDYSKVTCDKSERLLHVLI
jgi:hypothetical protein